MDAHDTYLVLTFSGETRVLGMNAGERGSGPLQARGGTRRPHARTQHSGAMPPACGLPSPVPA